MTPKFSAKKTAELVSFFLSSLIILGLFIYLGMDYVKNEDSPYLKIEIKVMRDQIRQTGEGHVIPVVILNRGDKTPTRATFRVTFSQNGAQEEVSSFYVEYLPKKKSKTVYLYRKSDPSGAGIEVTLENYQF
ncbi:MAG TPA: hypothetical protein VNJ01_17865 [Bacteriovoracaceae bacterium]|nr:hypothetical protein [Bacteriovoracaceae bacterium]